MKGKYDTDLEYGTHRLEYQGAHTALVSLNDMPSGTLGPHRTRMVLKGAGKLSLDVSDPKALYDLTVTTKKGNPKEQVDELPPPAPPLQENWLAQMRNKMRQEMGINRENFAEYRSRYETEDWHLFEEDLERQAKAGIDKQPAQAETQPDPQVATEPEGKSDNAPISAEPPVNSQNSPQ